MHTYRQESACSLLSGTKHSLIIFRYIFSLVHLIKRFSHLVKSFWERVLLCSAKYCISKLAAKIQMAALQFTAKASFNRHVMLPLH